MLETLEIGSAPADEECCQVGSPDYDERGRIECNIFLSQLRRAYYSHFRKAVPTGLRLHVKSNPHDFGTYYEVAASFNPRDTEALEAAYWFENNSPTKWDSDSKSLLERQ